MIHEFVYNYIITENYFQTCYVKMNLLLSISTEFQTFKMHMRVMEERKSHFHFRNFAKTLLRKIQAGLKTKALNRSPRSATGFFFLSFRL